jgi:hypothetical protein
MYAAYRDRVIQSAFADVGVNCAADVAAWIADNLADASRRGVVNRPQQMICAVQMEKIFEENRRLIAALAHLGAAQGATGNVSFTQWRREVQHDDGLVRAIEDRFRHALC